MPSNEHSISASQRAVSYDSYSLFGTALWSGEEFANELHIRASSSSRTRMAQTAHLTQRRGLQRPMQQGHHKTHAIRDRSDRTQLCSGHLRLSKAAVAPFLKGKLLKRRPMSRTWAHSQGGGKGQISPPGSNHAFLTARSWVVAPQGETLGEDAAARVIPNAQAIQSDGVSKRPKSVLEGGIVLAGVRVGQH